MNVSVCIATWSRRTKLNEIIELLEHQSISRDKYEIIVVDSNSPDGTQMMMKKLCGVYSNNRYYENCKNVLATKRNFGIQRASNDIIILIDDDVYPDYNFIQNHYDANICNRDSFFCGQIRFPKELCEGSNYYKFRDDQHLKTNYSGKN